MHALLLPRRLSPDVSGAGRYVGDLIEGLFVGSHSHGAASGRDRPPDRTRGPCGDPTGSGTHPPHDVYDGRAEVLGASSPPSH